MRHFLFCLVLATAPVAALAGDADVIDAKATSNGGDSWTVSATIRHGDTGWDHYADSFEVVGPDGTVLGVRTLHHPHVNEQPFTRSLSGVRIPADVDRVTVRAGDKVHGFGGKTVEILLAR